jgi:hypothetical protein
MTSQLPGITIQKSTRVVSGPAKTVPGIVVLTDENCPPPNAAHLPGIKVENDCCESNGNNTGEFITDSYDYIGYYFRELTYEYDISENNYPSTYWIIVDGNYEYVGIVSDLNELLVALNKKNLGSFTAHADVLTAKGFHQYGGLYSTESTSTSSSMTVSTSGSVPMLNIYASSAFDLSVENSIVGYTSLIDKIAALNVNALAWPTGAVLVFVHYVASGGDGWNSLASDALARGQNYSTLQDGDLYNGGVPYGRDFFDEYCYLLDAIGATKAILGVNLLMPLIPFSGTTINWSTIAIGALIAEIDIAIAKIAATDATVTIVELAMESLTNACADLFVNTGGAETTPAEIVSKLLTHTNAGAPVSILAHLRSALPGALLSIDGKLWDDNLSHDTDWIPTMTLLDIDVVRQYYQFYDVFCDTYEEARARVADNNTFWTAINDAEYNGKGVFISQFELKALNPVRSTVAHGLILAEHYLVMSAANVNNASKLKGMAQMNLKELFGVRDDYELKPQYYFMKQLGAFFDDDQYKIDVTTSNADANTNLVMLSVSVDGAIRVAVLNPTATEYTLDILIIDDAIITSLSATQYYSGDAEDPLSEDVRTVTETQLRFRPYSFTIITTS